MRNFRTRLLFTVVLAMAAASCAIVLVASGSAADDGVFEVTLLDGEIEIEGATLAPGRVRLGPATEPSSEVEMCTLTLLIPDRPLRVGKLIGETVVVVSPAARSGRLSYGGDVDHRARRGGTVPP